MPLHFTKKEWNYLPIATENCKTQKNNSFQLLIKMEIRHHSIHYKVQIPMNDNNLQQFIDENIPDY